MKKVTVAMIGLALLLVLGGGTAWWRQQAANRAAEQAAVRVGEKKSPQADPRPTAPGAVSADSPGERMARADKIRRDYDEMTTKFSADFSAAGAAFPGGLGAYLRQLALLQGEKHKDLAAILTPRELEDLELRETNAGQTVARLLGDTAATEEQRRAVFRLQKEFEDRFALVFDLSTPALLAREIERQAVQQKIRSVLGDVLFGAWLRGEGLDYAGFAAFARQQGLSDTLPLELWREKNEFILARLQLKARTDLTPAQVLELERALVNQTVARVTGLIGPAAMAGPGRDMLTWLPLSPVK